ncbi:BURP domain-containing protein [Quillaja saponaria]|uniref:BURP domain-containing protein n=1 Tax=Quillaja saponaria TaxID=32244 RepID=A0AAD7LZS7_QUISA|nr:BURP domain-containing protein [Quillaja saponaria]
MMGLKTVALSLFLYLLLLMCVHRISARELAAEHWEEFNSDHDSRTQDGKMEDTAGNMSLKLPLDNGSHSEEISTFAASMVDNVLKMVTDDAHRGTHTEHINSHHSTHMHHMDPSIKVFFTMKDLKVGKRMTIYFPKRDPATSPHFLPREEADSVPFSLKELPYLLQKYNFLRDSPQAKAMEDTLRECESKPIKGETKFCATSLESMLDFTHSIFGLMSQFNVLSTIHLTKSSTNFQNYTFLDIPEEISAPKIVACHTMPYPYAVFYCHNQESESKVYEVSLGGDNGDRVKAVVVCHLDTSNWGHNHSSFRVLGIEPGTSPVCHFFPADNLVYVPKSTSL